MKLLWNWNAPLDNCMKHQYKIIKLYWKKASNCIALFHLFPNSPNKLCNGSSEKASRKITVEENLYHAHVIKMHTKENVLLVHNMFRATKEYEHLASKNMETMRESDNA